VFSAAIETARPLLETAGHTLHTDISDGDLMLHADAQRLSQVFANVLNNACKYTTPGGTIWLRARAEAGELVVSVRDTGIGLTPAQCERIFDLFVQADASLERARGGLGIGLTLVRQLVEMHEGSVTAHSQGLGHGSEFVIRVPLAVGTDEAQGERAPARQPIAGRSLRILIVDDNRDGADMLSLTLGLLGHQVTTVYEPLKAVAAAESFLPDVAFLDIGMPELNGYDLAALLRRQPWASNLMLVALTGWGQEESRQRSAAAGFDEHLVKPIELETIDRICERALARETLQAD
jgi:CheY-like chemotaxis protein